jgi:hypothetical protein
MVIQKIVVAKKKQRVHTQYKNHEDALHSAYLQEHVGTHRKVNNHVVDMLESIGEF